MELAALFVVVPALVLAILRLYYRPPSLKNRTVSEAVHLSDATTIGRAVLAHGGARSSVSGVVALHDGLDAFGARISLIREAEVALDVQYYIWQRDMTGLEEGEVGDDVLDGWGEADVGEEAAGCGVREGFGKCLDALPKLAVVHDGAVVGGQGRTARVDLVG